MIDIVHCGKRIKYEIERLKNEIELRSNPTDWEKGYCDAIDDAVSKLIDVVREIEIEETGDTNAI